MFETLNQMGNGGAHLNTRLPKVLAELQGLTFDVLTGAAANSQINVASGIEIQDTIAKAIQFTAGVPSDCTANVTVVDRRAQGTLTVGAAIAEGDKVTVNGKVYTFKAGTPTTSTTMLPLTVYIGASNNVAAQNLANCIMSCDSAITCTVTNNVVTVIWRVAGVAGNAITMSDAQANAHVTKSGANLAGGTATQGIKCTLNTTGNTIMLVWFKKSRNLLQW